MEVKLYYESWYESTKTVILFEDNGNVFKYEYEMFEDHRHDYFVAYKNGKEIPERHHNVAELEKAGKTILSKGVYHSELNGVELSEEEADDLDFDEFVEDEERKMLLETGNASEILAAEAAEEQEKAAKEVARKEREEREAAEVAKKAAEEEARRATYGDEQDIAVLQILYKALQQSKKPKMIINYAFRFCPKFKSGRFEQPRTIIRAGGREYAFQFGEGWERIV